MKDAWWQVQLERVRKIAKSVWWICEVHYPHRCNYNDEADFLISGDGMGMFYAKMQDDGRLEILNIACPKWRPIFVEHDADNGSIQLPAEVG